MGGARHGLRAPIDRASTKRVNPGRGGRTHWGGQFNGEMKRLMLEHAFRFVRAVVFLIDPQNVRSQRAVEKIGATRSASEPDRDGRYVYRLDASTFDSLRSRARGGVR